MAVKMANTTVNGVLYNSVWYMFMVRPSQISTGLSFSEEEILFVKELWGIKTVMK